MIKNEDQSPVVLEKQVYCYACDQILFSHSMLICHECLNDECENFENLVVEKTAKRKSRK